MNEEDNEDKDELEESYWPKGEDLNNVVWVGWETFILFNISDNDENVGVEGEEEMGDEMDDEEEEVNKFNSEWEVVGELEFELNSNWADLDEFKVESVVEIGINEDVEVEDIEVEDEEVGIDVENWSSENRIGLFKLYELFLFFSFPCFVPKLLSLFSLNRLELIEIMSLEQVEIGDEVAGVSLFKISIRLFEDVKGVELNVNSGFIFDIFELLM